MDYENFDFYDLISVLIKNKKFIFLISFIVMVLSIIYLTFSSNLWVSQVKAQPLVSPSSIELSSLKNTTLSELTRGLRQTQQDIEGDRLIM
ncbi:MAG TPA: Wzz/FepE/Etk N-terminal domain-containing protein, partial [Candidatus Cloacimonadota bacterium]|nr:Wzz/FepE/Etk N-terminal domain-containing protein [Candidatus Cloacimonadota bacterium]